MPVYFRADSILISSAELTKVPDAEFDGCQVFLGRTDGHILWVPKCMASISKDSNNQSQPLKSFYFIRPFRRLFYK